jgi:hypothetical protein
MASLPPLSEYVLEWHERPQWFNKIRLDIYPVHDYTNILGLNKTKFEWTSMETFTNRLSLNKIQYEKTWYSFDIERKIDASKFFINNYNPYAKFRSGYSIVDEIDYSIKPHFLKKPFDFKIVKMICLNEYRK